MSTDQEGLCWHCQTYPIADNDLRVCETCWEEWLTHRRTEEVERCGHCGHDLRDHKTTMAGGYWCWRCPESINCAPPQKVER